MASISPVSYSTITPSQNLVVAATPASGSASGSPATDTTTYVTNADGSISVTTTDAQGEIVDISTVPAPLVISPSGAGVSTGVGGRAPGALLNLVA